MKRHYSFFVKDILDCIEKIQSFVGDMDYDQFKENDMVSSAVIIKLEIIGEATKNLPDFIREKYPEIPWKDMARMRDKIIHFYFGVDYEIVWKVIKERLPELKTKIEKVFEELKNEEQMKE